MAALVIWGYVFIQIYSDLNKDNSIIAPKKGNIKVYKAINFDLSSYSMNFDYPDPFRISNQNKSISYPKGKSEFTNQSTKPNVEISQLVRMNNIQLIGIMQGNKSNKVAIVKIKNENQIMKQGEKNEIFKLEKIYSDSVLISVNTKKFILKYLLN